MWVRVVVPEVSKYTHVDERRLSTGEYEPGDSGSNQSGVCVVRVRVHIHARSWGSREYGGPESEWAMTETAGRTYVAGMTKK